MIAPDHAAEVVLSGGSSRSFVRLPMGIEPSSLTLTDVDPYGMRTLVREWFLPVPAHEHALALLNGVSQSIAGWCVCGAEWRYGATAWRDPESVVGHNIRDAWKVDHR